MVRMMFLLDICVKGLIWVHVSLVFIDFDLNIFELFKCQKPCVKWNFLFSQVSSVKRSTLVLSHCPRKHQLKSDVILVCSLVCSLDSLEGEHFQIIFDEWFWLFILLDICISQEMSVDKHIYPIWKQSQSL